MISKKNILQGGKDKIHDSEISGNSRFTRRGKEEPLHAREYLESARPRKRADRDEQLKDRDAQLKDRDAQLEGELAWFMVQFGRLYKQDSIL